LDLSFHPSTGSGRTDKSLIQQHCGKGLAEAYRRYAEQVASGAICQLRTVFCLYPAAGVQVMARFLCVDAKSRTGRSIGQRVPFRAFHRLRMLAKFFAGLFDAGGSRCRRLAPQGFAATQDRKQHSQANDGKAFDVH
jgi:hypothetical protein